MAAGRTPNRPPARELSTARGRRAHGIAVASILPCVITRDSGRASPQRRPGQTAQLLHVITRQQLDAGGQRRFGARVARGFMRAVNPTWYASWPHWTSSRARETVCVGWHCSGPIRLRHREHHRDSHPRPGRRDAVDHRLGGPLSGGRTDPTGGEQARHRPGVDGGGDRATVRRPRALPRSMPRCARGGAPRTNSSGPFVISAAAAASLPYAGCRRSRDGRAESAMESEAWLVMIDHGLPRCRNCSTRFTVRRRPLAGGLRLAGCPGRCGVRQRGMARRQERDAEGQDPVRRRAGGRVDRRSDHRRRHSAPTRTPGATPR